MALRTRSIYCQCTCVVVHCTVVVAAGQPLVALRFQTVDFRHWKPRARVGGHTYASRVQGHAGTKQDVGFKASNVCKCCRGELYSSADSRHTAHFAFSCGLDFCMATVPAVEAAPSTAKVWRAIVPFVFSALFIAFPLVHLRFRDRYGGDGCEKPSRQAPRRRLWQAGSASRWLRSVPLLRTPGGGSAPF